MTIASPVWDAAPTADQKFENELNKYRRLCPDLEWDYHGGLIAWGRRMDGRVVCSLQCVNPFDALDGKFILQVS